MIPVDMIVKHDPDAGTYGDCYRACVASLMEMRPEDVPHFFEGGCSAGEAMTRLTAWLRQGGMYPLGLSIHKDHVADWCDYLRGYYILGGTTKRGTKHFVVATGRFHLAHDPHPTDKSGVFPDPDDNCYSVVLFVKLL